MQKIIEDGPESTVNPGIENEPIVTVVVVVREGFRLGPKCLKQLIDLTKFPFKLIYVDGNSPKLIAGEIEKLVKNSKGTLIRTECYLRPTEARNLGLAQVNSRYVVFLDNDVLVTPDWLGSLVNCAEDTGASFVSPVICIGNQKPPIVHVAGGINHIEVQDGRRYFRESYDHAMSTLADVLKKVDRQPTTMAEFHAVLVRTESLKQIDGLDSHCSTAFEHNDLCLSLLRNGGSGWLEPMSIVDYVIDDPAAPENRDYHLLRWSRSWIEESLAGFCKKWNLNSKDPALQPSIESLNSRRRRPMQRWRSLAERIGRGGHARTTLDRLADYYVDKILLARHDSIAKKIKVSHY